MIQVLAIVSGIYSEGRTDAVGVRRRWLAIRSEPNQDGWQDHRRKGQRRSRWACTLTRPRRRS